ncbi:MAG: 3-oxoacyl-[acyl-carrier-protein] reductase [Clostridiales Family XIII bacterium]|jgi:3-oxoacyl-[acyl-carrier protein] reductase|nr:3-oxoacyl-[acyl-carrier-protein] reductase [Clostridiales Family XIII bacterium]
MSSNLEGKRAIVTGGSRGIGRAIALALASEGAEVLITYIGNDEAAAKTVADLKNASSSKASSLKGDVGNSEFAKEAAAWLKENFDGVDILVNNAGITNDGIFMRMKDESFDSVVQTNLNGAFYMMREIVPLMVKQRDGRIINISSVAGVKGNPGQANYSASKAGLIGLSLSASKELGVRNIRVNVVAPGFIKTDMTAKLSEKQLEQSEAAITLKRAGEAEDVAELVAFLASDKAAYITGQVIAVDGGLAI